MRLTRRAFHSGLLSLAAKGNPLDRPLRWFQLAFTEDDPGQCNVGYWLDYLTRIKAEGVCLSAGGVVAFYPTEIPYHHRSTFLKNMDLFGEFVRECRRRGMAILARTDPHACRDDAAKAHPEWIHILQDGTPRRHWANPELWVTCAHGPYNFEFMTEVTREIASRYDVDGVFSNRWHGHGPCWCDTCRRLYRGEIPGPNARPEVRRAWNAWHEQRLFELWTTWQNAIQVAMVPNTGGGVNHDLDMGEIGRRALFMAADRQGRSGPTPAWASGKTAKEYRAALGLKPAAAITSVGYENAHRWKDSAMEPAEILLWMADGAAHGVRPWVTKFNAKPYDDRWMKPVEDFFRWHASCARYLRHTASLAEIGIVISQQSTRVDPRHDDAILGAYQALLEARIPFDLVHESSLDRPADLTRFKALVLPNVAVLGDARCRALHDYVSAGGGLVATLESSLYDEDFRRRSNFGCASLFAAGWRATTRNVQNAYLNLDDLSHPLLAGLAGAKRILHGVHQVQAAPGSSLLRAPLTEVPSYPDLPMEDVWPRVPRTDRPGVFLSRSGKGRVAYFPFDLDRTFWEVQSPDHGRLLANAVRWAADNHAWVRVEGPGVVDVAVFSQERSFTVHLVNLTNPMLMRGPVRELMSVGPQRIRLNRPVKSARWLVTNRPAPFTTSQGWHEFTTPPILLHEVLAVEA